MKNLIFSVLLLTGCGGSLDRQEEILKLRAIGASASPLVSEASIPGENARTVALTVYAAVPTGHTVDIKPYKDQESSLAVMLEEDQIEIQTGTIAYQDHPGFQVLSFEALLSVPDASWFALSRGAGQVRYGFLITDGSEVEKVIGNFMVYPEGAPELAWANPSVSMTDLADGAMLAADTKVDIAASLTNTNDEDLTVGWFVSGGEIENRRAKSTTWKTPGAGPQTVIVTVRGKKSRGFDWQLVTVNVE